MSPAHARRPAPRRGVSATELAVVLPVLMLLALGCIDFGRFAYHYIAVQNAARAGAEYGVMNPYNATSATATAAWKAAIQTTAQAELTGQSGCTPGNLATATTASTADGGGLRRVTVVATYSSFQTLVTWPGIPPTLTLQATVEMRAIR